MIKYLIEIGAYKIRGISEFSLTMQLRTCRIKQQLVYTNCCFELMVSLR